MPNFASQSRAAFSSMDWKTGSKITGRRTDDAQHVRRRCLLLQRFAQFVQQPRILDGDDGLGGEVSEQLDLLVGERANFSSVDANAAYRHLVLQHWSGHQGTEADLIGTEYQHRIAFAIAPFLADIENMDYLSSPHCASRGGVRSGPAHALHEFRKGQRYSKRGADVNHAIVQAK